MEPGRRVFLIVHLLQKLILLPCIFAFLLRLLIRQLLQRNIQKWSAFRQESIVPFKEKVLRTCHSCSIRLSFADMHWWQSSLVSFWSLSDIRLSVLTGYRWLSLSFMDPLHSLGSWERFPFPPLTVALSHWDGITFTTAAFFWHNSKSLTSLLPKTV